MFSGEETNIQNIWQTKKGKGEYYMAMDITPGGIYACTVPRAWFFLVINRVRGLGSGPHTSAQFF